MVRPRTLPVLHDPAVEGEGQDLDAFEQTCRSLEAVLRQLEALLPPGLEGLAAVHRLQSEVEDRTRPWRSEALRAKSA